ncbi:hypothetical protein [Haematobacter missouriensis]|uniref:hypothetical protein n=1 Tax=Haematobacter missouriensis TaxID=366616 RepID=UPI001E356E86|nr:hypothetical protein [Haematobacter missouriensis]
MARLLRLLRRRVLTAIPVLLIVVLGTFLMLEAAPGDAVDAYLAGIGGGDAASGRSCVRATGWTFRGQGGWAPISRRLRTGIWGVPWLSTGPSPR